MVYTRRPATQAQANNTTPAYSTMATRNSPATAQYQQQQQQQTQYGNSVTTQPATNYQQSYSTTTYQQQSFPATPAKTAPTPQAQAPVQALKTEDNNTAMETGEDGEKPKRRFGAPGGVRYKPNKRLKRAKRNDTLRKVIKPKNSIMCLHELITGLQFNVQDLPPGQDGMPRFSVTLQAYGKTYEGIGNSKLNAKQVACENALKGILVDRMAKQAQREAESKDEPMYDENGDAKDKGNIPEDNIPWVSVASFALHKLFSEWQGQGTHFPLDGLVPGHPNPPAKPVQQQVSRPMPENPLHYQPVMLLHMVRPSVTYNDTTNVVPGGPPTFTSTCVVDGKTYSGSASKKKVARKNAAKAALLDMGVNYPADA